MKVFQKTTTLPLLKEQSVNFVASATSNTNFGYHRTSSYQRLIRVQSEERAPLEFRFKLANNFVKKTDTLEVHVGKTSW